jgi:hypothetical protein
MYRASTLNANVSWATILTDFRQMRSQNLQTLLSSNKNGTWWASFATTTFEAHMWCQVLIRLSPPHLMFCLWINPKTRKDPLLPRWCLWRSSIGKPFRLSYVLELPIYSTRCLGLTLGLLLISHTHTTKFVYVTCIYSVSLLEEELLITSQNFSREISILNYYFLRFLGS